MTLTLAEWYAEVASDPSSDIAGHFGQFHNLVGLAGPRPTVIELGVRNGNSSAAWLHALDGRGELWSVDRDPIGRDDLPDLPNWHFVLGDDLDPGVLAVLPWRADIVFIDTDHSYEHTTAELRVFGTRCRWMLCHDTEVEDPRAHGEDIPLQAPFPVRRAVRDYCAEMRLSWTSHPHSYGLAVIRT